VAGQRRHFDREVVNDGGLDELLLGVDFEEAREAALGIQPLGIAHVVERWLTFTFPVFDDGSYPATAVSEMDAELLFIDKHDMHLFCVKYPLLALTALRLMAARVRRHAQLVEALSFHDVGHRLASFLINEVKHANSPVQGRVELRLLLSNQEIASRIGSVRDVVSRTLARMRHDGLISLKGRTLIIPDMRALKLYAASPVSARLNGQTHPV